VEGWEGGGTGAGGELECFGGAAAAATQSCDNGMAASRRALLWQAKVKTATLKGFSLSAGALGQCEPHLLSTDRKRQSNGEGDSPSREQEAETAQRVRDLRAMARKHTVGTWQEVDQESSRPPACGGTLPHSIHSKLPAHPTLGEHQQLQGILLSASSACQARSRD